MSETYQEILKAAVLDGRLDAAESPAAVLNELISQVGMPGEQVLTQQPSPCCHAGCCWGNLLRFAGVHTVLGGFSLLIVMSHTC